jgi:AcrR family transcriptional regulator
LYHHFDTKKALFAAVLEAVEVDIASATARASANAKDPAILPPQRPAGFRASEQVGFDDWSSPATSIRIFQYVAH